jgi:HEPN domain-containing protein
MKSKLDHARGWFLKADSDLSAASQILSGAGPYDTACFHAQQAIEKLLKGMLAFHEQAIPRTHDLEELAQLCEVLDPSLKADLTSLNLAELSDYAVILRYDSEFWPEHKVAKDAADLAAAVRSLVLSGGLWRLATP